jgi:peptide chain release factor 3
MELEQKRGISITSTALQFPYREHVLNLLDTPGHRDFSEDTYRVLAAVDAVVMVLDSAKGIEPQTLKLFEVCRSRDLPVVTFLNKYDRPGRESLELLDEIEDQIGLRPTPATWPVGLSGDFRGVIDRRTGRFTRYTRTARGGAIAPEEDVDPERAAVEEGSAWSHAHDECGLLDAIGADVDLPSFLAGQSTPVFVGSALTNFGVRHVLDAIVDLAPAPGARRDAAGDERPVDAPCSAFVFKVQANMDRSHRDRIAFVRICSGRFDRGMVLTNERTGKPFATKYASTVFGAERSTVEEAFPGDVVGLVNATGLNIGDSLYDGEGPAVRFPPIPRFSPEVFASARPLDSGRFKQFRRGLAQLDEEGVVQVLRDPDMGDSAPVLAAVGQLQFDVFADRLDVEFGAPIEILGAPYEAIRLTDPESAQRLRSIGGIRILTRGDGELVALFESRYRLQRLMSDEPELRLDPIVAG